MTPAPKGGCWPLEDAEKTFWFGGEGTQEPLSLLFFPPSVLCLPIFLLPTSRHALGDCLPLLLPLNNVCVCVRMQAYEGEHRLWLGSRLGADPE